MVTYKFTNAPAWVDISLFEEAIKQFRFKMLFQAHLPAEKISIQLKPKFHTACWSFAKGVHQIFLGLDIFKGASTKKLTSREDGLRYLQLYLDHEMGHALNTFEDIRTGRVPSPKGVRDPVPYAMQAMQDALLRIECSFSTWNLFEDSRIEELQRSKNKLSMNWSSCEELKASAKETPGRLFFLLIQLEGAIDKVESTLSLYMDDALDKLLNRVYYYYKSALLAAQTEDLLPLLEKWVREFPQYKSTAPPGLGQGAGAGGPGSPGAGNAEGLQDLALSFHLSQNPAALVQFEDDCIDESDLGEGPDGEMPEELTGLKPDMKTRSFKGINFLSTPAGPAETVDGGRVQKVLNKFARFRQDSKVRRFSDAPSKRVNMVRDLLDRPMYMSIVPEQKAEISAVIFLDCSGSMQRKPMLEAKTLIAALSALAVSGRMKGHLILTCATSSSTAYHRLKFPVSAEELKNIRHQNGGEGLEAAMMAPENLRLMSEAKRIYAITDGNLTDAPLNKAKLHARGIFTTAIYVGNHGDTEQLETYFDRYFVRDSIEEVVEVLIQDALR